MAEDHRIEDHGRRLDYTCENVKFKTDTHRGHPHRAGQAHCGNVFNEPLAEHDGYSLWLEHVVHKENHDQCYWLMWYRDGRPTIPLSGVFWRDDIANMSRLLASFVP
jgi:hypothetical protein